MAPAYIALDGSAAEDLRVEAHTLSSWLACSEIEVYGERAVQAPPPTAAAPCNAFALLLPPRG
ncbi:hypothetical protein [Xanthomonas sacchari]|uniref:hypothetical protein n=1 Tax=Xanthomonas sacchari TaxID=56458 RepID=UPI0027D82D6F|nr:hypothetical protein [Xanthomonas sacchari]